MRVIIVGGGVTGLTLANLIGDEHQVTILEMESEKAKEDAEKTEVLVVHGDGSDISVLKEVGLVEVDAVVATADDKTNLMVCEIAKSEGVEKVISLVNEPKNEELFTKLGINDLVSAVGVRVTAIKKLLDGAASKARIIAQMGDGALQIVEVEVGEGSVVVGKKVGEVERANVAGIYRMGEYMVCGREEKIEEGDVLLIVVRTEELEGVRKVILGG